MDLWISKERKRDQWNAEKAELSYFIQIMTILQSLKQETWHLSCPHQDASGAGCEQHLMGSASNEKKGRAAWKQKK